MNVRAERPLQFGAVSTTAAAAIVFISLWSVSFPGQRAAARAQAEAAAAQRDKLQSLCRVLQEERGNLMREIAALKGASSTDATTTDDGTTPSVPQ